MRTVLVMALVSIYLLCSCTKDGKALDGRLLGEWLLLNEPADEKRFRLGADGDAFFMNIRGNDVGIETHELLSVNGSWTLSPNGKLLRMKFVLGGATYDHTGKIVHKRSGLEIWFSVGDPDDYVWRRFRKRDARVTKLPELRSRDDISQESKWSRLPETMSRMRRTETDGSGASH